MNDNAIEIDLTIPAAFWPAVGYTGDAQFVAVYWGGGDEAYHDDGRIGATGNWEAYLVLLDHPANRAALSERRWWLGSSEELATHWLVADREHGRAWLMPAADAQQFLARQWPPAPTSETGLSGWDVFQQIIDQMNGAEWQEVKVEWRDVTAAMGRRQERLAALRAALNTN